MEIKSDQNRDTAPKAARLRTSVSKRNLVISLLLFLIVVVQIVVMLPQDIEPFDQGLELAASRGPIATKGASSSDSGASNGAQQVVVDAYMVEAKASGKEVELWAKKAYRPNDLEEWTLENVRAKFYASNGVIYTVTGDSGGVTTETYAMWIKGNVVTRSSNGYVFRSESAFYDPKAKKLKAPNAIDMQGPADSEGGRLFLTGDNMIADMTTNQMIVHQNVRARRQVHGGRTARIQARSAVFSGKTNSATLSGAVVIDIETMRVTGPEAKFVYDPQTENLDSVMVAGGVRVTDADKYATSGSLSVFFKDDRYVFRGSPRVVQREDELIGDEIVFLNGGKQVQVLNAKAQVDPSRTDRETNGQTGGQTSDGKGTKRQ
ncbi:MAG: LPS export ABC transporter periplasmic protein LptC [Bdellovibrionales bacterium]|jgi:LPS export ABC transporter protein LptC|nr:LPS export ABC transporter periplasmic protein LptC [Bdellovibrionales bacterium]